MELLNWLAASPLSLWMLGDTYCVQLLLCAHSVGMAIVVGVVVVLDVRVLGYAKRMPVSIFHQALSLAWWGFALNAASGILLFITNGPKLIALWTFQLKMALIVAGGFSVWLLWRTAKDFPQKDHVFSNREKILAALSILFWFGAHHVRPIYRLHAPAGMIAMTEMQILDAFKHSPYGVLMVKVPWLFSAFETIHFIGLSILIGALLFVDLRMLGAFKAVEIRTVLKFVPVAMFGFALNVITGLGFFCNDPPGYWTNPMFKLKLVFIAVAGLNAGWFTFVEQRKLLAVPEGAGEYIHPSVKFTAGLSLLLWFLVILAGRLLPTFQSG